MKLIWKRPQRAFGVVGESESEDRDEAEDAAEDRSDELEDLEDDNSGKGSDD